MNISEVERVFLKKELAEKLRDLVFTRADTHAETCVNEAVSILKNGEEPSNSRLQIVFQVDISFGEIYTILGKAKRTLPKKERRKTMGRVASAVKRME